ncbi:hypothetical protein [Glycomyces dulcitolivorans]|uniref:hypothetical protein n=1 Tax=Glycomyces dulcitolivorans TaxID=2200759 RepID=UPI000DD2DED1|nr:hypothetical protein [Glycomyces dulcitolivorans]
MSTPDDTRFEEAFADFAHAAELMVDPVDSAVIHGRVRRRRTTKGAAAAALAALIVAVPAVWWLQESNGDEVDPRPAEETTDEITAEETTDAGGGDPEATAPEGQESGGDELVLPSFGDLVGAEIALPSFADWEGIDESCPNAPATLADGTPDWESGQWYPDDGPVWLLKVLHVPLEDGGPNQAVALIGCATGESMVRQAVVVAGDGEGGWEVTEELPGVPADDVLYDIAPAATTGVLLMVVDQEPTGSDDDEYEVGYEILRYRTGEDLVNVTDDAYLWGVTDIASTLDMTDNGDGTWTAEVTVTNAGDHESQRIQMSVCNNSEEHLAVDGEMLSCVDDTEGRILDPLEPGESVTFEWTLTPSPLADWTANEADFEGVGIMGWIRTLAYSVDGFAYDPKPFNAGFTARITAADME